MAKQLVVENNKLKIKPVSGDARADIEIVSSGGNGTTTLDGPVVAATPVTIPGSMTFDDKELKILYNHGMLMFGIHYSAVGTSPHSQVTFTFDLQPGHKIQFYK